MENSKKNHGCLKTIFAIVGIIVIFLVYAGSEKSNSPKEDYNDNSRVHQIIAKNFFKDYIKDNLNNAKSYEEVDYNSKYNYERGCYEVTLKYRASNAFGALMLQYASGDVYFIDDKVSIRNVRIE